MRTDRHPLISFRQGASGRRRPGLGGTRLQVGQVIATLRGEGGDIAAAAEYLSVPARMVQAAVNYYADFTAEVDELHTSEQVLRRRRAPPLEARAAGPRLRLLLDEHYAEAIAHQPRAKGFDAVTVSGLSLKGTDDEPLLEYAVTDRRRC